MCLINDLRLWARRKLWMRRVIGTGLLGVGFLVAAGGAAMSFQRPAAAPAQQVTQNNATPAEPAAEAPAAAAAPAAGEVAADPVMALGQELYTVNCVACHGAQGEGPARVFANNENLKYTVLIASQVVFGGEFMPKFPDLTDEEIAAIGTYIRNSWGNAFGPVTAEEVKSYR